MKIRFWQGNGWGAWKVMKSRKNPEDLYGNQKYQVKILHKNEDK
jgi:hypothetical protein